MRAAGGIDEQRDLAGRRRTAAVGAVCAIALAGAATPASGLSTKDRISGVSEISTALAPEIDLVEGCA